MLRLAATGRWLGYLALVIVFAIVCSGFGVWQWQRRGEALAAIDRLESNYDRTPQAIPDVLESTDSFELHQQWTPVSASGEYLVDEQLLLRGRSRDAQVGFDVIVPFLTDQGTILYVDRGWVAGGDDAEQPDSMPQTPSGHTEIVVRLRPDEGAITGRGAPAGQIASVDLTELADGDADVYTGAYGLLVTEGGDEASGLSAAVRPVLDEGPHLSYCLQWFVFALMGFFGFGWALRQEARGEAGLEPRPKRRTDADEEDEILDA